MAAGRVSVLAFAKKPVAADQHSLDHPDLDQGLVFRAAGMIDPPRPEAITAVLSVSGYSGEDDHRDHALTAGAIAR